MKIETKFDLGDYVSFTEEYTKVDDNCQGIFKVKQINFTSADKMHIDTWPDGVTWYLLVRDGDEFRIGADEGTLELREMIKLTRKK